MLQWDFFRVGQVSDRKLLFRPGAMFWAIRPASIRMVPLPQSGSSSGSFSGFHLARFSRPAARVSLRGAMSMWAR